MSKVSLRLPKGPTSTEIWWFAFYNPEQSEEEQAWHVRRKLRHDGPAGVFEQDDGENWGESTTGTRSLITRRYPLHYRMNLGRGEIVSDETGPPRIDTGNNEHSQLWFYHAWSQWMSAASWPALEAIHSKPEGSM
jgi:3-phenylpropionate/trans-cinnamate dioxygenase alpha subunit